MRMAVVGKSRVAMMLESETSQLDLIAKALWVIAREINYGGRRCREKSTTHGATFIFSPPLRQSIQFPGSN
jgi:hypothetical protein